jgi:hypothetical protein
LDTDAETLETGTGTWVGDQLRQIQGRVALSRCKNEDGNRAPKNLSGGWAKADENKQPEIENSGPNSVLDTRRNRPDSTRGGILCANGPCGRKTRSGKQIESADCWLSKDSGKSGRFSREIEWAGENYAGKTSSGTGEIVQHEDRHRGRKILLGKKKKPWTKISKSHELKE